MENASSITPTTSRGSPIRESPIIISMYECYDMILYDCSSTIYSTSFVVMVRVHSTYKYKFISTYIYKCFLRNSAVVVLRCLRLAGLYFNSRNYFSDLNAVILTGRTYDVRLYLIIRRVGRVYAPIYM